MTTALDVLKVAKGEIGYIETPNNITKYWQDLDPSLQGEPWCGAFVSWVFKMAGLPLPSMDKPYGFVYCPDAVNYAKAHDLWSSSGKYAPGDIILYSFIGGLAQHTGLVVADDGATVTTIEGNTSSGVTGSQINGGGVYQRLRVHGGYILGVFQTSKLLTTFSNYDEGGNETMDVVRDLSTLRCYLRTASGRLIYIPDGDDLKTEEKKFGLHTDYQSDYLANYDGYIK